MILTLKDREIGVCVNMLDFYSRMYMGQYEEIDFVLRQHRFNCEFDNQFTFARKHIYTAIRNLVFHDSQIAEWDLGGSLGIWSEQTDARAKNAYDMQQVVRNSYAWCCSPEGGIGRDFDAPLFGGELMPIKCECVKNGQGKVMNIFDIEDEHINIMIEAVQVNLYLYTIKINKLMRYYTDDERALELAIIVEKLYGEEDSSNTKFTKEQITILRKILRKLNRLKVV